MHEEQGTPGLLRLDLTQPCSNRWQNAQNERLAQALSGCGLAPVPVRIGCGFCRSRRVNDVQPFRVERNLDEEENGDDEDAKDSKDSKAKDDEDKADSNDKEDSEEDAIERRRDYWRDRLDREW